MCQADSRGNVFEYSELGEEDNAESQRARGLAEDFASRTGLRGDGAHLG
jgi:hypothetical protein